MQNESPLHRDDPSGETASTGRTLSIGEVGLLLGLPAPTIRSWERRHGLSTTARDERGHRRYTDNDVAVLRRMRDQRSTGMAVGAAAAVAQAPSSLELCGQMLAGTHHLDGDEISAVLDVSLRAHGLAATLEEVLLPAMREVGVQWSRGHCDVANEHLATAAVLAWLARRAPDAPPPLPGRPIVLSGGPQDQHTIGLEAFAVLLRHHRFDCRNLGAQTPAASLRFAVERSSAAGVVVASQLARNRPAAVAALKAVSDTEAVLFYAGAAFRSARSRQSLPGHHLRGSLSHAADLISSHLGRA
ncbi:B12 binding domain-containing protein [Friedmanniella luteola]|uniref:B12 binding domain-containing protein n=1 Tax=Friedmanniella luteola TaxID=546871 RepID=A0A1H1WNC5_9ACTN|nr:MerR family transcriptional regulator [Friedmanniella luteola]SDS98522.1 B12 binding domain-containing protein [Friedmanniella luteola]